MCCGYSMNEKEKMEAIWFANKHTNDGLKYWVCSDSGATISVMNDKCLFDSANFTKTGPVKVQTTGGMYDTINTTGVFDLLPIVHFDKNCFMNIWCQYDIHNSKEFEITDVRDDLNNKYIGYDAYISKYDVTLNFRYHGKLLMANIEELILRKNSKVFEV